MNCSTCQMTPASRCAIWPTSLVLFTLSVLNAPRETLERSARRLLGLRGLEDFASLFQGVGLSLGHDHIGLEQGALDRFQAERLLHLTFYPVGQAVELADGAVSVQDGWSVPAGHTDHQCDPGTPGSGGDLQRDRRQS